GLVLFVPQAITPSIDAAAAIIESAKATGKPLAAVLAGGATVAAGQRMLDEAGVPQFLTPENAVDAIALLDAFERNQRKLRQVPHAIDENCAPDVATANALYEAAAAEGRSMLDQIESKRLLRCFGIAAPPETVAATPDDAVRAADAIGYPVVLKILSPDITHKSDVGGVRINIQSAAGVRSAAEDILDSVARMRPQARIAGVVVQPMIRSRHQRELYVGASTDAVFGAVIAFGAGGVAVEQLDDVAIALPPLNANLARSLIERPRIHRVLRAYRNVPAIDFEGLEQALLRFSTLVCACPWIAAIDINPLLADESRVIALDARVEIKPPAEARQLRWRGAYGHLAIHPYPRELEQRASLRDGSPVLLRPIRPEDADAERRFVASLSRETLYRRFMMPVRELSDAMIERFTQIDYDRELAMVALRRDDDDAGGGERFVGVARIVPTWDDGVAEFAIVVADSLQRSGLGSLLMRQLFDAAKARGYREIVGMVLAENRSMLAFCERLGFTVHASPDDPAERVVRKPLD
ncbi:MAG TPA: GNAT family N-acetyltransferase, partial [Burkholderiaceae bacterium]|nr:GNAT family N-acetyltransferase [Burkholderiaceae bacterium]